VTGEANLRPGIPRGERGAITVADRAVAKIASRVAREALSRFTESVGHVPPGRRTPRVTTSVRRAPERDTAGRDAESAGGQQAALGEARMRMEIIGITWSSLASSRGSWDRWGTPSADAATTGSGLCAGAVTYHSSADATPGRVTACPAVLERPRRSRAVPSQGCIPSWSSS
jgi:hypothetical protein